MKFVCETHGESVEYIMLGVNHTKTSGTERDWEKVGFTVIEPDKKLTIEDISFSDPDYVSNTFHIKQVKEDMLDYFFNLVEEDNQPRLAERGTCSEGEINTTCFPRVKF